MVAIVCAGFFLLIFCIYKGCYFNPYWKLHANSEYYANGIMRAIIGIPAWVAVIMLLTFHIGKVVTWLVITACTLVIPCMKLKKDELLTVRNVYILVMASMGTYARLLLNFTILGIPVCQMTKRAAEIGWEETAMEFAERSAKRRAEAPSARVDFREIFAEDQKAPEPEEKVEVFIEQEDGSMKQTYTNSDQSMYWDPDAEDWVKIKK